MLASQEELCSMEFEFILFLSSGEKVEKQSSELGSFRKSLFESLDTVHCCTGISIALYHYQTFVCI
jgi:hypothetical protein